MSGWFAFNWHSNLRMKLLLSLATTILVLFLLELAVRGYHRTKSFFAAPEAGQTPPLHIVNDLPFLYGLNPEDPDINSLGLRDDEVTIPKPAGTFRILILGDSVVYGKSVSRSEAFPDTLEQLLRERFGPIEVINGGVSGYTPYNELQFYLTKGRKLEADLVVIGFCMNDVANPRLHWGDAPGAKIPAEAIPNHQYDNDRILPKLQKLKEQAGHTKPGETGLPLLKYSKLYRTVEPSLKSLFRDDGAHARGSKVPTYITGEDELSIEVLLDRSSSEWRWLASMYDRLSEAVRADKAKLVIAVFPLAYQLDEHYPFLPQKQITEYCNEKSIPCLDLLPSFRQHGKEDIFILDKEGAYDIWHLTKHGHKLSAREIMTFLRESELLPPEKTK